MNSLRAILITTSVARDASVWWNNAVMQRLVPIARLANSAAEMVACRSQQLAVVRVVVGAPWDMDAVLMDRNATDAAISLHRQSSFVLTIGDASFLKPNTS